MANSRTKKSVLNMMAVQLAAKFPGNREDDRYVLERVRQILDTFVYAEEEEGDDSKQVVRLNVVRRSDQAS